MEYLPNGLTLDIPEGCFPLSTDSIALAEFVKLPKNKEGSIHIRKSSPALRVGEVSAHLR